MEIAERTVSDITVLDLKGKMTLGEGDELLKDKINSLLQQGNKKLLLDLGNVSYVDSAGLGQLVQVRTTAANGGGALKLVNVTKRLKDLLVVTKLVTVFDSYETEAEALASFGGAAKA